MFTLEEGLPFHAGARNNSNNHKKCSTANILILSKRSLVVCVRAALEEDGPLLCCVVLRRVCAVGTDSGFIQQGCAEDGALQPLDEEDGGGVFWVGFGVFWFFLRRRGEKVGQDDWPRALMASHPLSDCTETLVRRRLVSIHLQRQPALIRWWTGVWHRARLPHDLLRCLPDRRLWRIPLSPTEKCFAKLFFFLTEQRAENERWKILSGQQERLLCPN